MSTVTCTNCFYESKINTDRTCPDCGWELRPSLSGGTEAAKPEKSLTKVREYLQGILAAELNWYAKTLPVNKAGFEAKQDQARIILSMLPDEPKPEQLVAYTQAFNEGYSKGLVDGRKMGRADVIRNNSEEMRLAHTLGYTSALSTIQSLIDREKEKFDDAE